MVQTAEFWWDSHSGSTRFLASQDKPWDIDRVLIKFDPGSKTPDQAVILTVILKSSWGLAETTAMNLEKA